MARPTPQQIMDYAADTHNGPLMALLIATSSLEFLHLETAHQPASLRDRAQALKRQVAAALDGPDQLAPVPAR